MVYPKSKIVSDNGDMVYCRAEREDPDPNAKKYRRNIQK